MPEEGLEPPTRGFMIARRDCGGVRAVTGFRLLEAVLGSKRAFRLRAVSVASADTLLAPTANTKPRLQPKVERPCLPIVLKEAQLVLISTGETIKVSTVRVSLASVDCWFVGHFQSKTPAGGMGFFAIFSPGE
jgi:hypothetical protein